jgi:beta-carotene/zeaxanthin 4-ketolase
MQISSTLDGPTLDNPLLDSPALDSPLLDELDESEERASYAGTSLAIAGCIVLVWATSIVVLFTINLQSLSLVTKILILPWQTFLYTGLFITAHDAMHGAVYPPNRAVNDAVGTFVLWLYGLFSFKTLLQRHIQHHRFPASETDPDYKSSGFLGWYWTFMSRYWSWTRFIALVLMFHLIHGVFGVPESNLAWFWVYPSVLSSLHLFYFGTYLPHRQPEGGYSDEHRSTTIPRPWIFSLLACYHFGYHHEHHRFTDVPWWQLPSAYQKTRLSQSLSINAN